MSEAYDQYIKEHCRAVGRGVGWMIDMIGEEALFEILPEIKGMYLGDIYREHDQSKWSYDEYQAYDAYFYGPRGVNRKDGGSGTKETADDDILEAFNYAWLHHIHNNPHHWQYWVLVNDDKELGNVVLEMPDRYILEMIADWWSFSWRKGDLYEIFSWWNDHCDYILLGEKNREKVLKLLRMILDKLNELGGNVEDYEGEIES